MKSYPKIMVSNGKAQEAVFFYDHGKGVCISGGEVGAYKDTWDMSAFKDVSVAFVSAADNELEKRPYQLDAEKLGLIDREIKTPKITTHGVNIKRPDLNVPQSIKQTLHILNELSHMIDVTDEPVTRLMLKKAVKQILERELKIVFDDDQLDKLKIDQPKEV